MMDNRKLHKMTISGKTAAVAAAIAFSAFSSFSCAGARMDPATAVKGVQTTARKSEVVIDPAAKERADIARLVERSHGNRGDSQAILLSKGLSAVPYLAELLKSSSVISIEKAFIIDTLEGIAKNNPENCQDVVKLLIQELDSYSNRNWAGLALSGIGKPAIQLLLERAEKDPEKTPAVFSIIERMLLRDPMVLEGCMPRIYGLLKRDSYDLSSFQEISKALMKSGNAGSAYISQLAMSTADDDLRLSFIKMLGEVGGTDAVRALEALSMDGNSMAVRLASTESLAKVSTDVSTSVLLRRLDDTEWAVRRASAKGLGAGPHASAKNALRKRLKDSEWRVAGESAKALAALESSSPTLASAVLSYKAILEISKKTTNPDLMDVLSAARSKLIEACSNLEGDLALPLLSEGLKDSDISIRKQAVTDISNRETPEAFALLRKSLQEDPEWEVRVFVIGAISDYEDPPFTASLEKALSDKEWRVQVAAAEGLAKIGTKKTIPLLRDLAKRTKNDSVKKAAEDTIASLEAK